MCRWSLCNVSGAVVALSSLSLFPRAARLSACAWASGLASAAASRCLFLCSRNRTKTNHSPIDPRAITMMIRAARTLTAIRPHWNSGTAAVAAAPFRSLHSAGRPAAAASVPPPPSPPAANPPRHADTLSAKRTAAAGASKFTATGTASHAEQAALAAAATAEDEEYPEVDDKRSAKQLQCEGAMTAHRAPQWCWLDCPLAR